MAKRRKRSVNRNLDSMMGRAILAAESVRGEFVERLLEAIAEVGPLDEMAVVSVVRTYLGVYEPILAEHLSNAMILTWLEGYVDQVGKLPSTITKWMREHAYWAQIPPEIPGIFGPGDASPPAVRFPRIEKAAESLFKRGLLTRPQYDRLEAAAKQATFTVAWIDDTKVIGKIRDALAEVIDEGPTLEGFRERVREKLDKSPMGPAHSENVYRTGLMSAYRDGQASLSQHPIVQEVFKFRDFYAVHDGRVRDEHLAFEKFGIGGSNIYLADDPIWDIATPPLGYNCRCETTLLRIDDAARYGLKYAKEWLEKGYQPEPKPYCIGKVDWRPDPGFGVQHGPLLSTSTGASVRMSAQPIRLGDANPWQPYKGPRGGTGWQHSGTGDVRYGGDRPGAHEMGGGDSEPSKPKQSKYPSTATHSNIGKHLRVQATVATNKGSAKRNFWVTEKTEDGNRISYQVVDSEGGKKNHLLAITRDDLVGEKTAGINKITGKLEVAERPGAHETGGDDASKTHTVAAEHDADGSVRPGGAGAAGTEAGTGAAGETKRTTEKESENRKENLALNAKSNDVRFLAAELLEHPGITLVKSIQECDPDNAYHATSGAATAYKILDSGELKGMTGGEGIVPVLFLDSNRRDAEARGLGGVLFEIDREKLLQLYPYLEFEPGKWRVSSVSVSCVKSVLLSPEDMKTEGP